MRIRIHLSTCSGDEDRTVLDLQIGKWQTGLTEISPLRSAFFYVRGIGRCRFEIHLIWLIFCHIGIGSTLPTRHSTTRCRAYPVTENCRSDLSLTNGNLVTKSQDKMPEMLTSCRCYVYFWYFWIWCSFLWKTPCKQSWFAIGLKLHPGSLGFMV